MPTRRPICCGGCRTTWRPDAAAPTRSRGRGRPVLHRDRTRRGARSCAPRRYDRRDADERRHPPGRAAVGLTPRPFPPSSAEPLPFPFPCTCSPLTLLEQPIAAARSRPTTPAAGKLIAAELRPLGFDCHDPPFGPDDFRVSNLWAKRPGLGGDGPTLVFAGHTDVVPTGPVELWSLDPSCRRTATAACGAGQRRHEDPLAAMVEAVRRSSSPPSRPPGRDRLPAHQRRGRPGARRHGQGLRLAGSPWRAASTPVVGEPTSVERLGDMVKNGRRGSMSDRLTVRACRATSPTRIWRRTRSTWRCRRWPSWPPSSGTPATTTSRRRAGRSPTERRHRRHQRHSPARLVADFNFRFSTESDARGPAGAGARGAPATAWTTGSTGA